MHRLLALIALVALLPAPNVAAQPASPLTRHDFVIHDFRTESGVVLPEARIVYTTLGTLNAAGDNAILLPSHYMANINGYNWLIGSGPDRALDPSRDYLVLTELFGNGRSSSPSNTPEPFHGPRFPVTTIRDNVEAVHHLLTDELKVRHLRAVVGFSMGAQQAFQWAVSYPDFVDRIVATSGTAKCYGHGYVRLEGQIAALTTDPAWQGGEYTTPPKKGLEAFGVVWAAALLAGVVAPRARNERPAGRRSRRRGSASGTAFSADANDYILQARTGSGTTSARRPDLNGDTEKALRSIRAGCAYAVGNRFSFPSAMRATSRRSFPASRSCRSRRCGDNSGRGQQSLPTEVPERERGEVFEVTKDAYGFEKSTSSRTGALVTVVVNRRVTPDADFTTMSRVPRLTGKFVRGVSPTFCPSTSTSAGRLAVTLSVDGAGTTEIDAILPGSTSTCSTEWYASSRLSTRMSWGPGDSSA